MEAQHEEIISRWNSGLSARRIAEEFGLSIGKVQRTIQKVENIRKPNRKVIDEAEIIKRWNAGMTQKQIASQLGISVSAIRKRLHRASGKGKQERVRKPEVTYDIDQETVVRRWNAGESYRRIGRDMNIPWQHIQRAIYAARKQGIKLRDPSDFALSVREAEKTMDIAIVDEGVPDKGIPVWEMPATGCRHVHGGTGVNLRMCGRPSERGPLTYLCEEHKKSYARKHYKTKNGTVYRDGRIMA